MLTRSPQDAPNKPEDVTIGFAAGTPVSVNGKKMSAVALLEELNRIVHPAVVQKQEEWMEEVGKRHPDAVTMVEAALIVEAGAAKRFDQLVVVTCRPEQRVQRWAQRLKVDQETARREVTRRMAAQLPDEEKIKFADYVIDNSGSLDQTEKQVREIYPQLAKVAKPS